MRTYFVIAWAFVIIVGGLMITPGGIFCIVCGPTLTVFLGIIFIALGVIGIISAARTLPKQTTGI